MPDKPIIYAEIPAFDQETQYVMQTVPVDMGDYIYVGVQVCDVIDNGGSNIDMP
jgi:hypothetical protein